jgi:hypothetical protein
MTAEQPYTTIKKYPEFEIRHYPSYVLIQVKAKGEFSRAASMAFRPLVNYISGSNQTREKFAMTAPVLHAPEKDFKSHVVSFVLPEGVSVKDLPIPADAQVTVQNVDAHYAAAHRFRGMASEEHFKSFGERLADQVKTAGLKADGDVFYARYDPPWKPGILRRNEAIIALKNYSA